MEGLIAFAVIYGITGIVSGVIYNHKAATHGIDSPWVWTGMGFLAGLLTGVVGAVLAYKTMYSANEGRRSSLAWGLGSLVPGTVIGALSALLWGLPILLGAILPLAYMLVALLLVDRMKSR